MVHWDLAPSMDDGQQLEVLLYSLPLLPLSETMQITSFSDDAKPTIPDLHGNLIRLTWLSFSWLKILCLHATKGTVTNADTLRCLHHWSLTDLRWGTEMTLSQRHTHSLLSISLCSQDLSCGRTKWLGRKASDIEMPAVMSHDTSRGVKHILKIGTKASVFLKKRKDLDGRSDAKTVKSLWKSNENTWRGLSHTH